MSIKGAKSITITDFSQGQNNEFDPRVISPNADGEPAEAQLQDNFDIDGRGALITAPGYALEIDLGTNKPVLWGGEYAYDPSNRHMIACSNEHIYQIREATILTFHDCDLFNSPTYGTFSATGDAAVPTTDTGNYQRGGGAVSTVVTVTGANSGQIAVTRLSPLDLSTYEYIELLGSLSNVMDAATSLVYSFTSVTLRFGTDAANYYEQTFTTPLVGATFEANVWFGLRFALGSGTVVGAPSLSNIQYMQVSLNYAAGKANFTFLIDNIVATKSSTAKLAVDITGPQWQATAEAVNIINGAPYKGVNATPLMTLANKSQSGVAIRHVGPEMVTVGLAGGMQVRSCIVASVLGFLFTAKDNILQYSGIENETTTGGSLKFDGRITGLAPTVNKTMLVTIDEIDTQEVRFNFDDTTLLYTPVKGEYQVGTYGYSHKSIQKVNNNSMFLGNEGVAFFGQTEQQPNSNYRTSSLSWKIDKTIQSILNYEFADVAAGYYSGRRKEYGIAIPAGRSIDFNNKLFVYKTQYDAWFYRSGIAMAHAWEFRRNDKRELYFGSSQTGKIYKFNNFYDFDGSAYTRRYKFKVFNMGLPTRFKGGSFFEFAGAMPPGCEFYVIIKSDGREFFIKVDDASLVLQNVDTGGYIGDENIGDEYIGGAEASDLNPYPMYRFYTHFEILDQLKEFRELEVEIYQYAAGQPLKIDFFNMEFDYKPGDMIPDRHRNSNQVSEITTN